MKKTLTLTTALMALGALALTASPARADWSEVRDGRREIRRDRAELNQDRRELRNAWRSGDHARVASERREIRDGLQELRRDHQELRGDVREARRDHDGYGYYGYGHRYERYPERHSWYRPWNFWGND